MHPDTSPSPLFLTRVRDRVYFAIHDELGGGWQLWRTDGTGDGTALVVRDLGSDIELTGFGDQVAFGVRGALWMSDGTGPGTRAVKHLPFFPTGLKGITGLTSMDDVVLFSDGNGGLWRSDGTEAGTTMVRHLDPRLPVHDLTPAGITKGDETIFFRAVGGDLGAELWRSDGTEAGTVPVVDLKAGGGSFPGYFRVFEKRLYFSADGGQGFEPWVSDGTPEGTISLGDLNPTGSSYARHFREAGDLMFFAADQGLGDGTELWRTDGTPQGTRRVRDINPRGGSLPNALVEMNGVLYFRADDGTHGSELWRSDGTAPGTRMVTDLAPHGSAFPRGLLAVGDVLVFTADDGVTGEELWRTDGTASGTVRLVDLDPTGGSTPRDLRALGGRLVFSASDDGTGRHLFAATDCLGNDPGDDPQRPCRVERLPLPAMPRLDRGLPFRVRDIRPGAAGSSPYALTAVGRTLFFRATDDAAGTELWKSDGTELGTELVRDVRPGRDSSHPYELTNVQGTLFFQADDGTHGPELWASDGTAAGTRLVHDTNAGGWGAWPEALTAVGDRLFFRADDGTHGAELWTSDGTEGGTSLVLDIHPTGSSAPADLTPLGATLYFTADDGPQGRQVWRSDGTPAGTTLARGGFGSGRGTPSLLTRVGDRVFFRAGIGGPDDPASLWASSGATGTQHFAVNSPEELVASSDRLFFTARDHGGRELWALDGDTPRRVHDIAPHEDGSPRRLTDVNGTLFFYATDGTSGWELWASDGTAEGTRLVVDADPTDVTQPSFLTKVGDRLYFSAHNPSFGRELWVTDGSPEGSGLVANINPVRSGYPESLVDVGGTLFFYADDGASGEELWALTPCGDGRLNPGETCDDGNRLDGDGCSRCRVDGLAPGRCSEQRRCVAGRRLEVVDGSRLALSLTARDAAIVPPAAGDDAEDPRVRGMVTVVRSPATGEVVVLSLPADGWRLVRRRGRSLYRYRGRQRAPCRKAVLGRGLLRLRCRTDAGALHLTPDAAQRLEVRALLGDARAYCLAFAGHVTRARGNRPARLRVRGASAPDACR
jgi:ELWxxDGT repeat protein/cysteine-rich repeat protein